MTSNGEVLLNIARFAPKRIEEVARMALRQRGAIFIGVVLSPAELKRLLDEAAMLLPKVGPMVERRHRGELRRRASRRD